MVYDLRRSLEILERPTDRGDNHVPQLLINRLTSWIAIFNQDQPVGLHQEGRVSRERTRVQTAHTHTVSVQMHFFVLINLWLYIIKLS